MKRLAASLLLGSIQAQYDYSELVYMKDYSGNVRTLNAWECFEARGKFCHDKSYASMMQVTGSSNRGHGLCCKTDYDGEGCGPSDAKHDCSPPAENTDPTSPYAAVVSAGNLLYHMFAFNPTTNQRECGIADSDSSDMTLMTTADKQTIATTSLKY